jgi:hypothetical protein
VWPGTRISARPQFFEDIIKINSASIAIVTIISTSPPLKLLRRSLMIVVERLADEQRI